MADDDNTMDTGTPRGFAAMPPQQRSQIASEGGKASPGKFTTGSQRARDAGRKGGQRSRRSS